MELIKVKRNYQLTIPKQLRKRVKLAVGDYVEVDIKDGAIVMQPVKVVHPGQEYFFTREWQEGEAEADRDIAGGNVLGPFDNVKEAIEALKTAKA